MSEQDAIDAARYRWLKLNAYIELQCDSPRVVGWVPERLDAAVDAAAAHARMYLNERQYGFVQQALDEILDLTDGVQGTDKPVTGEGA